jgi:hypothetical protein
MPAAKKRPHPRSLDALFPRPKVKRCHAGHSQTPEWRASWGCSTCRKEEEEFARRQWERTDARLNAARLEREEWSAGLGPPPIVMTIRTHDGTVQTFHPGPRRRRRRA